MNIINKLTILASASQAVDLKYLVLENGDMYDSSTLANPGFTSSYGQARSYDPSDNDGRLRSKK